MNMLKAFLLYCFIMPQWSSSRVLESFFFFQKCSKYLDILSQCLLTLKNIYFVICHSDTKQIWYGKPEMCKNSKSFLLQMIEKHKLSDLLVSNLLNQGYSEPTSIQKQAWPLMMQGREILGCAPTGSGRLISIHVILWHRLKSLLLKQ